MRMEEGLDDRGIVGEKSGGKYVGGEKMGEWMTEMKYFL